MIARLISELRIRRAWAVIEQGKRKQAKRERRTIRATAQQMRMDMGLPPDRRLAG